jgi:hypothetical protein
MMNGMGLICDYFAAPSDESAAEVVDHDHGPAPAVPGGRIDPIVVLGTVTALLTGRTFGEVLAASDRRDPVAMQDDGPQEPVPRGARCRVGTGLHVDEQL